MYNRFWHSRGGGERHSGMIASLLSREADVELLSHEHLDLTDLAAHLGLDLSATRVRLIGDESELAVEECSAEYDLFVNASHGSRVTPRAPRSAYLCYFPTPLDAGLPRWRRLLISHLGPHLRAHAGSLTFGTGWFPPEGGRRRRWVWTGGEGVLVLSPGPARTLRFELSSLGLGSRELEVRTSQGEFLARFEAGSRFRLARLALPASTRPQQLHFISSTSTPGPADERSLGVACARLRLEGGSYGPRERITYRFPWLVTDPRDRSFLERYDVVLANSEFTRSWVQRLWSVDAEVCYPPIDTAQIAACAPATPSSSHAIITVGRFFRPGLGHAKRQLEMVEAFARAYRRGLLPPDAELWVVGGCEPSQRDYLREVEDAGAGLPVRVLPNLSRPELHRLLHEAAVCWSATGLGEDEEAAPWALEHFGMTTVEAMSAGCVPVVIDRAGQREIVRSGVDGFRFDQLSEMISRTAEILADDELRARLAREARERAQEFSEHAFAARLAEICARHHLLDPPDPGSAEPLDEHLGALT